MTAYYVTAWGCDDGTAVIIELTDAERDAVAKVAELITAASSYSCMPRLSVRPATPADHKEIESDDDD